jgi:hypothetical protein
LRRARVAGETVPHQQAAVPRSFVFRREGGGVNSNGSFKGQQAPCGQLVDGESYEDHDDEVVVTQEIFYSCGCQSIQHEYHDGSISRKVVRHDGKLLVDEMLSAE